MSIIRDYRAFENPKEVGVINSNTQVTYYCPECGDTIVTWSGKEEKPIIPKFCGHCFCPIFDPIDDIVADIKKAIAESGE